MEDRRRGAPRSKPGRSGPPARRATAPALLLALVALAPGAQAQGSLPSAPTPTQSTGSTTISGTTSTAASGSTSGSGSTSTQGSTGGGFPVQVPTQSSLFNPYLGSVQAAPAVPRVIPLTLDDAYRMGIANNLGLVYAKQGEVQQRAQRLQVLNVLLPNIDIQGSAAVHQYNLEAQGFRPGVVAQFSKLLPSTGGASTTFPTIVKVDVTKGQANFSQYLFDWAGYDLVKALGHLLKSTVQTSADSRGQVVQNVGVAYLRVIAAQSQVAYDQTLLTTDAAVLYQSQQEHQAGIVANLDELRARVQYQTEQQALIADQGALAKTKIALNRSIGLAPEQEIEVADATPFPELETMSPEAAERQALAARQDYQSSIEQLRAAEYERKAATRERYPTLIFNGNYGVTGVSGGIYHGTFAAVGTLNIPVFQEAKFRADRDTAEFTLENARAQVANVRGQISQQVRGSLIDLQAASATVSVAKSNVALSQVALEQTIERFRAGIEDNLPAIEAESTLAQAQVQFINASFQYNQAKLNFARNLGLIDVDFHPEWQGGRPVAVLSDRAAMGR